MEQRFCTSYEVEHSKCRNPCNQRNVEIGCVLVYSPTNIPVLFQVKKKEDGTVMGAIDYVVCGEAGSAFRGTVKYEYLPDFVPLSYCRFPTKSEYLVYQNLSVV